MKSPQTRLALLGLTFGILLALWIAPQTHWLVRLQIAPGVIQETQSRRQFIASQPNDYPVQLADAPTDPANQLQYTRSLIPRFPESASLRANILRYATQQVHLHRADSGGGLLSGKPDPPLAPDPKNPPPTVAQLAAFDADAAAGERLDPDNAYFPFMRSIGLFAAHRDAEALAAITRAGAKPAWREYCEDEVEGGWRIQKAVYGHREALGGTAIMASMLLPQYAALRAVARLVTVKSVQEEQAGQREQGLALRRSLGRLGDLMRAEGTTYITNLVGIAITAISRSRPGGAEPIVAPPDASSLPGMSEKLAQKRLDAYCDYVTQLGHPDAAREARAQAAAGTQIRHLDVGFQLNTLVRLAMALAAGWLTVTSLTLFLLLGLAANGLSRLPRIRERRPLPAGASLGIWITLLLSILGTFLFNNSRLEEALGFMLAVLLVPLAASSLYAVFRPAFRLPLRQAALAGLVTLVVLGLLVVLVAWQTHNAQGMFAAIPSLSPDNGGQMVQAVLGLGFASILPLLLIVILSITARIKRVPVSAGLVEGYRAWTPAVACTLAVLYGGVTVWTIRQESAFNYGLEQSLHGEGQYMARLTGRPWPGPVR